MRKGKLLGFKKFTAKNGKVTTLITLVYDMEQRESDIDCSGSDVEKLFLPVFLDGAVTSKDVGKDVVFMVTYIKGQNGEYKPNLISINLV